MKLKLVTPPAVEPVDLYADIKPQLRIDPTDTYYDEVLIPLVVAAREWCETYQNRAYITQTYELALDEWPEGKMISLPRPPLTSVESVRFTDFMGVTTTWGQENYVVDDFSEPARLVRAHNVSWPSVSLSPTNGVKIRYTAGYGNDSKSVPAKVKQAIILLVNAWFDNPDCEPPQAVKSLLSADRVVPI